MDLSESRKGFFFTLLAVVFLFFIMVSTSVWLAAQKQGEERISSKMNALALKHVAQQASNEAIKEYVAFIGYRALLNLTNDTITYAGGQIDDNARSSDIFPNKERVKAELCSIIVNGTRLPDDGTQLAREQLAREQDTLSYWAQAMKESTQRLGLNFSFNVTGCRVQQNDAWHVNIQLDVEINISNRDGTLRLDKSYAGADMINAQISIEGIPDPYITVMDYKKNGKNKYPDNPEAPQNVWKAAVRQIYKSPHTLDQLKPQLVGAGTHGKGWAYGNITNQIWLGETEPKKYILYLEGDTSQFCNENEDREPIDLPDGRRLDYRQCDSERLNKFIGIVLQSVGGRCSTRSDDCPVGKTVKTFGECTCTYHVTSDGLPCFDCAARYEPLESSDVSGTGCTLSDCPSPADVGLKDNIYANEITIPFASTDGTPIFLSDYVDNHKSVLINAYSWCNLDSLASHAEIWDIEKLRDYAICGYYLPNDDAPSFLHRLSGGRRFDASPGIETTLVGMWASEDDSKIDWKYYGTSTSEKKIKGMPGCKDFEMCDSDGPLGHFKLDLEHYTGYDLGEIVCDETCEDNEGCSG